MLIIKKEKKNVMVITYLLQYEHLSSFSTFSWGILSHLILQHIYAAAQGSGARSWQLRTVVKGSKPLYLSFLCTYEMLVSSMAIPNWVRLTGFASPQVDGEIRQKGSTQDMMFKIPFLISHISSIMTLLEGDVILTGIA